MGTVRAIRALALAISSSTCAGCGRHLGPPPTSPVGRFEQDTGRASMLADGSARFEPTLRWTLTVRGDHTFRVERRALDGAVPAQSIEGRWRELVPPAGTTTSSPRWYLSLADEREIPDALVDENRVLMPTDSHSLDSEGRPEWRWVVPMVDFEHRRFSGSVMLAPRVSEDPDGHS